MNMLDLRIAAHAHQRDPVQDILAKFNGKWTLTPLRSNGEVTGCSAVLEQDLLPKGAFLHLQCVIACAPAEVQCADLSMCNCTFQALFMTCRQLM